MSKGEDNKRLAQFLYEAGMARKLLRAHRQLLLTDDLSDNIASHSYRVTLIGWILARMEDVDPGKVIMMCLLHDIAEIRTGDHNYLNKRYIKEYEDEALKEQLGDLPIKDLYDIASEYEKRESKEAIVAKDADLLDQVLLLKEYAWQGNNEAETWLKAKGNREGTTNIQLQKLKTQSGKELGEAIMNEIPSDWWNNLWQIDRRK